MIEIIQGDCLEVMKTFDDNQFDLVLTDPPYGLDIEYDTYIDTRANLGRLVRGAESEIKRVSNLSAVFCGVNNIGVYDLFEWVGCWFYGTTGNFGKFGYNSWQPFLLYGENNNRFGQDTIKYSKMEKRCDGHPCSKPVGLMVKLIERFTKIGDTVLDPFLGSGTTAVACERMGRNCVGIEISEEYCEIARKRVQEEKDKMGLFPE